MAGTEHARRPGAAIEGVSPVRARVVVRVEACFTDGLALLAPLRQVVGWFLHVGVQGPLRRAGAGMTTSGPLGTNAMPTARIAPASGPAILAVAEVAADEVGSEGAGGVHRGAGDRAAPQPGEGDVGTDAERPDDSQVLGADVASLLLLVESPRGGEASGVHGGRSSSYDAAIDATHRQGSECAGSARHFRKEDADERNRSRSSPDPAAGLFGCGQQDAAGIAA
jgi:hypothetical protein